MKRSARPMRKRWRWRARASAVRSGLPRAADRRPRPARPGLDIGGGQSLCEPPAHGPGASRPLGPALLRRRACRPRRGGRGRCVTQAAACDQMAERSAAVREKDRRHPDRRRGRQTEPRSPSASASIAAAIHPAPTILRPISSPPVPRFRPRRCSVHCPPRCSDVWRNGTAAKVLQPCAPTGLPGRPVAETKSECVSLVASWSAVSRRSTRRAVSCCAVLTAMPRPSPPAMYSCRRLLP